MKRILVCLVVLYLLSCKQTLAQATCPEPFDSGFSVGAVKASQEFEKACKEYLKQRIEIRSQIERVSKEVDEEIKKKYFVK